MKQKNKKYVWISMIILALIIGGVVGYQISQTSSQVIEGYTESTFSPTLNYDQNVNGNTISFSGLCRQEACHGKEGYAESGKIYKVNGGTTTDMLLRCFCKD